MSYRTLSIVLGCGALAASLPALALRPLSDAALDDVSGQEGISLMLEDFRVSGEHSVSWRPNPETQERLILSDLVIDDGNGGTVSIGSADNPIRIDADGTDGFVLSAPRRDPNYHGIHLGLGTLSFDDGEGHRFVADQIHLNHFDLSDTYVQVSGHSEGISLGLALALDIGSLTVASSAHGDHSLELHGVHVGSADGDGAWVLTDVTSHPLRLDVGTGADGAPHIVIEGKVELANAHRGNIRIDDVVLPVTPYFNPNHGQAVHLGAVRLEGMQITHLSITPSANTP